MNDLKRKKLIKLIHVAKGKLGLTETEFEDLKLSVTGKESCAKMDISELKKTYDRFRTLGFKAQSWKKPKPIKEKEPLRKKIGALLADMNLPWSYADGIARKMFNVEAFLWCSPIQMHSIAAALEYHKKRRQK